MRGKVYLKWREILMEIKIGILCWKSCKDVTYYYSIVDFHKEETETM